MTQDINNVYLAGRVSKIDVKRGTKKDGNPYAVRRVRLEQVQKAGKAKGDRGTLEVSSFDMNAAVAVGAVVGVHARIAGTVKATNKDGVATDFVNCYLNALGDFHIIEAAAAAAPAPQPAPVPAAPAAAAAPQAAPYVPPQVAPHVSPPGTGPAAVPAPAEAQAQADFGQAW